MALPCQYPTLKVLSRSPCHKCRLLSGLWQRIPVSASAPASMERAGFLPIYKSAALLPAHMPAFRDPETYRDILDGLQIGVSVLDLQKKIVFWSDGAEQITGYARIDVLGHSCADNILLHCNQVSC